LVIIHIIFVVKYFISFIVDNLQVECII
jgi:hypothetical protein